MLQIFRARIGSLRKALKSRADLVFVDGPHALTATDDSLAAEAGAASANQRAWWSWQARCAASAPFLRCSPSAVLVCALKRAHCPCAASLLDKYSGEAFAVNHGQLCVSKMSQSNHSLLGTPRSSTSCAVSQAELRALTPRVLPLLLQRRHPH